MATRYAKATGKIPAVVLHTTVARFTPRCGARRAAQSAIPMVVLAGESIRLCRGARNRHGAPVACGWLTDGGRAGAPHEHCVKCELRPHTRVILPHTVQRAASWRGGAEGPVFVSVPPNS